MRDLIATIKCKAKQLTIDIVQLGDERTLEQLHGDSLDLLLKINELETKYNQACPKPLVNSKAEKKSTNQPTENKEDTIRKEINKIHRKLPNWATRQQQINSRILTLFLKLEEEGISNITEQLMMERYGNQQEFYRNFPQMKTISSKNHGKVFDVQNGIVKIWEPIRHVVQEYKNVVFRT